MKKIQLENADMRSELQQLRAGHSGRNGVLDEPKDTPEISSSFTLPPGANFELDDSAAIDPSLNYFLTPFLGKNDHIASILNNLPGMDGIEELSEESQPNSDSEDVEPVRSHTPDYPVKPPKIEELKPKASSEALSRAFLKPPKLEPSGLSRTAPLKDQQRRDRSHSSPSQPQSRAQSPFKPMVSSICPTPPIQTSASISAFTAFGLDETSSILQSRLQDILSDRRSPGPSSSLPSSSSSNYLPSSFGSRDRDTFYPTKGGSPPTQDTVPVKVSSASAQAKVLEDERKRKRGEELEHRRMLQAQAQAQAEVDRRPSAPIPVPASSSASGQAARNHPPSSYTQHYPGHTPPNAYSQTQQQNVPSRRGSTSASSLQAHYASRTNHAGVSPSQEQLNGSAPRYPTTPSSMSKPSSIPVKKNLHPGYPSAPSNTTVQI